MAEANRGLGGQIAPSRTSSTVKDAIFSENFPDLNNRSKNRLLLCEQCVSYFTGNFWKFDQKLSEILLFLPYCSEMPEFVPAY